MRVQFNNTGVNRVWGAYRWDRQNQHVTEVDDAGALAEMLSQPINGFSIAPDEPMLQWMTADQAATLVLYGDVATVADLADLEKAKVKKVAEQLGETQSVVNAWVKQANQYVKDLSTVETAAADAVEPPGG
jgi:hypothetical protein